MLAKRHGSINERFWLHLWHDVKEGVARTFFSQWSLRVPQQRDSFDFMTTHHCEKRAWLKKCWLLGSSADPELPAPAERVWKVRIARLSQKAIIQHTPTDCLTTSRMLPTIEPGRFSQWSANGSPYGIYGYDDDDDHCEKSVCVPFDFSQWCFLARQKPLPSLRNSRKLQWDQND